MGGTPQSFKFECVYLKSFSPYKVSFLKVRSGAYTQLAIQGFKTFGFIIGATSK